MTIKRDENGMPLLLRWATYFIERVGFPVFACAAMFWMGYKSMYDMSIAMNNMTRAMSDVTNTLLEFRAQVRADHQIMLKHIELDETDRLTKKVVP